MNLASYKGHHNDAKLNSVLQYCLFKWMDMQTNIDNL